MQLISSADKKETPQVDLPVQSPQKNARLRGTILLFLLPSAILYIGFVLFPVIQAAYYSFFSWNGLGDLTNFVFVKNYGLAFADKVFLKAVANNLLIVVLSLLVQLPFALMLALVIGKTLPGRAIFRVIFFMPYILSDVVTGVIWQFIYRPEGGLMNIALLRVIPGFQPQLWLADPKIVLFSIFLVMVWKYFGLHLVLYVAAIQNIPDEVIDAARIDGSSTFQVVRYITIPLLGSIVRLSIFLSILGSLQYFDLIWIMSNGGPVHASETMATYLMKYGFQSFAMGYGSAIGVIMFATCFVFALMYQRVIMRQDLDGSVTGS